MPRVGSGTRRIAANAVSICTERWRVRTGRALLVLRVSLKIFFQELWVKAHEAFMGIWLPSKMAALARQISQRQISDTFLLWKESEKYIFNPRHTAIWARANKYNQPTLFGAVHSAVNYTPKGGRSCLFSISAISSLW